VPTEHDYRLRDGGGASRISNPSAHTAVTSGYQSLEPPRHLKEENTVAIDTTRMGFQELERPRLQLEDTRLLAVAPAYISSRI